MTETSAQWDGTVLGDAATYAAAYCHDEVARYQRSLSCLADRTAQGPVYSLEAAYNGQLECTNPAGIQIDVDTGRAIVNGYVYENDASVTLNPVDGDGFYRVVLQLVVATQTIRLVLLYNAVATPALTQNAATWEVALANFEISGGAITAAGVVDERVFVNAETKRAFVPVTWGYNILASTDIGVTQANNAGNGPSTGAIMLPNIVGTSKAGSLFVVPPDFISNGYVQAVTQGDSAGAPTNVYCAMYAISATYGENANTHAAAFAYAAEAVDVVVDHYDYHGRKAVHASTSVGDFVNAAIYRDTSNALDTLEQPWYVLGFVFEYFGYKR